MPAKCRVCSNPVAYSAKACPNCGAQDPSLGKVAYGCFQILVVILVLPLLLMLVMCVAAI